MYETPIVGALGRGACAFQIRPRIATNIISWAPGAHVRFGDLDFIVTLGGELMLTHTAAQPLPSINPSHLRLEGPWGDSLGP